MPYAMPPALPTLTPVALPPGVVDAAGRVARDVSCRKCAYNLRGLPVDGNCPECGRAVGLSIVGDLLRYSDPAWLVTLRRGVTLILLSILAMIVVAFIGGFLGARAGNGNEGSPAALMSLGAQLLGFFGAWFLTAPDPSGVGEDLYGTSRNVIRVTLLISMVQPLVNAAVPVIQPSLDLMKAIMLLGIPVGIAGLVGQFAQLQYLGKLATRIPDPKLTRRANFLKWAIGISYGVLILVGALVVVAARAGGGSGTIVSVGCFAGLAGLALIVFGIMYLLMLERFGKAFKREEQAARATWAAAAAASNGGQPTAVPEP
jgi:hypothetical protein